MKIQEIEFNLLNLDCSWHEVHVLAIGHCQRVSLRLEFSAEQGECVAAPWNPKWISVDRDNIIIPIRFEHGCTVDLAGYMI